MTDRAERHRDEIRNRVNRASIGAWQWNWGADVIAITIQSSEIPDLRRAKNAPSVCDVGVARIEASRIMDENDYAAAFEQYKADAEFIAHARTDIPDLLAQLETAERERASLREDINRIYKALLPHVAGGSEYTGVSGIIRGISEIAGQRDRHWERIKKLKARQDLDDGYIDHLESKPKS